MGHRGGALGGFAAVYDFRVFGGGMCRGLECAGTICRSCSDSGSA